MKIYYIALILLTVSCSSKDPKMCECLSAGKKLNDHSAKILSNGITKKDAAMMKRLKNEKKLKCADFQTMSGEEMLKKSEGCK